MGERREVQVVLLLLLLLEMMMMLLLLLRLKRMLLQAGAPVWRHGRRLHFLCAAAGWADNGRAGKSYSGLGNAVGAGLVLGCLVLIRELGTLLGGSKHVIAARVRRWPHSHAIKCNEKKRGRQRRNVSASASIRVPRRQRNSVSPRFLLESCWACLSVIRAASLGGGCAGGEPCREDLGRRRWATSHKKPRQSQAHGSARMEWGRENLVQRENAGATGLLIESPEIPASMEGGRRPWVNCVGVCLSFPHRWSEVTQKPETTPYKPTVPRIYSRHCGACLHI